MASTTFHANHANASLQHLRSEPLHSANGLPEDAADAQARGVALYRDGAYAAADELFAALVGARPDDAAALRLLGLCRVRLGDPAAGVTLLARAAALSPHDAEALLHYGLGLLAAGRPREAAELFRRTIALLPEDPAPPLNLATALLMLGDPRGARRAARKAQSRAPDLAEAHYTRGLAEAADGALAEAATAFARATALAPQFAEAWVNLGVTRYRLSNITGAKRAMQRALDAAPGHAAATANLAVFERLTGDVDEAEARIAELLARDPDNPEARLNRASELLGDEGGTAALELLQGEPPGDPVLALTWRLQKLLALLLEERLDEARALMAALGAVPPAFSPLLEFRRLLLALHEDAPERARAHAETMEQQLRETPGMLPEHRIMGWYDVGRFWRRQDEPARAFAAWTEGHRLLALFQPFSRDDFSEFMQATMAAFDRARLHHGPRASNADPAPVFIVGMPRSGTTLAEQILASHGAVHGAGERFSLAESFRGLGGGWESARSVRCVAALGAEAFDREAERYLAELHALAPDKLRVVDKMPGNFRLLGYAALLLPGARVIHCERDPRDIGASIFRYRFLGYHPYAHDLADLGWYIARQHELMRHWQEVLPIPLLTVRLTDWIDDFDATLRRVLAFLDLPYDPACERFYENEREVRTVSRWQVRSPINAQGIGSWREFAEPLAPLIAELTAAGIAPDDEMQAGGNATVTATK